MKEFWVLLNQDMYYQAANADHSSIRMRAEVSI